MSAAPSRPGVPSPGRAVAPSARSGLHADDLQARKAALLAHSGQLRAALMAECLDAWIAAQGPLDTARVWHGRVGWLGSWLGRLRALRRLTQRQPWLWGLLVLAWRARPGRRPRAAAGRHVHPADPTSAQVAESAPLDSSDGRGASAPGVAHGLAQMVRNGRRAIAWVALGWQTWRALRPLWSEPGAQAPTRPGADQPPA